MIYNTPTTMTDPWTGWSIDPATLTDMTIGKSYIVTLRHDNGAWWLKALVTITDKIDHDDAPTDWVFRVDMFVDGSAEMMRVFDEGRAND